ncbi:bactofilin family protein [Tunturiibacter lichenicola]|jgi:cytoskeletal protein CcmA (bactofilin family)|uniref:bactofilin family protein n=1 Tax=Tunturiibacter lichenicola TaxID=2051959 RepID=UPI0021B331F2|nr:polymer-forming cytoskeletal protein [Edaphobacter lichenicola]
MSNQRVNATSPLAQETPHQVRLSNASDPTPGEPSVHELATIGKSLLIRGDITGSESLSIEGRVEGSINLPGNRVTVRRNGQVSATIAAREIVVLGHVDGRCEASDNLDIGSEGSLNGDVVVSRISVEDGAIFTGSIDMR